MKKETKFYVCKHCGNMVTFINESGVPLICCGEKMQQVVPNTTEAVTEKHIPIVSQEGNTVTVTVGSVLHPMLAEHYIQWIYLETEKGSQIKYLNPSEEPVAVFELVDDKFVAAYEYCNLHGLWRN